LGSAIALSKPVLILAGILSLLLSAMVIGWVRNPVWAVRFDDGVAFIKNVHPSILELESLPEWPSD
jgi:hypothetical protein